MRDNAFTALDRLRNTFRSFSPGQKAVALVGSAAVLVAAFFAFNAASAPSMASLYSNLSPEDAAAVVEELEAEGVPYEIGAGGGTIMVPQDVLYDTRIKLSGSGIPSGSDGGYSLLDEQGLSTSDFQQQTTYKRAIEGELSNTIEAIDGVDTAVVQLAIPEEQLFTEEQQPTTAGVLVDTGGRSLAQEQVSAIVNLLSSSVENLDEDGISVTDASGAVLKAPGSSLSGAVGGADSAVSEFGLRMTTQVQGMLDRVVGAGNSIATVTPVLDFDNVEEETTRYFGEPVPLSSATSSEELEGAGDGTDGRGILGPDGQMEIPGGGDGTDSGNYSSEEETTDFGVNRTIERRQAAPGAVESLHVGVLLDAEALGNNDPEALRASIASALGIDETRGDTIEVTTAAFDRTAEEANAAALAAAEKEEKQADLFAMLRNGGIALLVLGLLAAAFFRSRRRNNNDEEIIYAVEALPQASALTATTVPGAPALPAPVTAPAAVNPAAAALALEAGDESPVARDRVADLVDSRPDEAADLLRGWLSR